MSSAIPSDQAAQSADWWKSAVVYQIYPRSFSDSNADGVGDIPGIISRVDYLASLGVDVVWLSPVYRSPMDDNGYDISDYRDVDPIFGTLSDLDALIAALHERGMKLMLDVVVNHTSDEHPWFIESRSSLDSPKRDWYWWRPPREDHQGGKPGAEPTNWEAAFSGSAWTWDEATEQYYLHLFSPKQPDLNWENPDVRAAVYEMLRWWVDRGVDGFRCDVINVISKPRELVDGQPRAGRAYAPALGLAAGGPRLHEFLAEMHAEVFTGRSLVTVGETPGATVEQARLYTDPARRELDMVFTFEHVTLDSVAGGTKWDLQELPLPVLKGNLAEWQRGLSEVGWNSLYWNNHDQPRAVSRFGDDRPEFRANSAKTLGTVLHLHKGTPYVYQGEELGMTNAGLTEISQYQDLESVNYHADALSDGLEAEVVLRSLSVKSRDNARTPMQWDDNSGAGFSQGVPWLAPNPNYVEVNVTAAQANPDSVFHHYRRLIELRHDYEVVREGTFELLLPEHEQLWVFTRTRGPQTLTVAANCSSGPADLDVDLGLPSDPELLLATHADATATTLQPWESRVWLSTVPTRPAEPAVVLGNSQL